MAHVKKFTKAATGHMFAHFERAKDEKGEYVKFGNQNIDSSRTHLNYNLAPKHGMSQGDFVRRRCTENGVKCMNRKDVNVMCSWIVTAPAGFPEKDYRTFFDEAYKFLAERYGEKNAISAYVHMDESQPHIHFAFVPVIEDRKKGGFKVSAKELVNKQDLLKFHPDLTKHMTAVFGYDIGIENGATKLGNQTVEQLKEGTKRKQALESAIDNLSGEVKELRGAKDDLDEQIQSRSEELNALSDKVDKLAKTESGLDKKLEKLSRITGMLHEIENPAGYKENKTLFGGKVKSIELSAEAFELIQNWVLESTKYMHEAEKLRREVKDFERIIKYKYVSEEKYDELLKIVYAYKEQVSEIQDVLKENPRLSEAFDAALVHHRAERAAREEIEREERAAAKKKKVIRSGR